MPTAFTYLLSFLLVGYFRIAILISHYSSCLYKADYSLPLSSREKTTYHTHHLFAFGVRIELHKPPEIFISQQRCRARAICLETMLSSDSSPRNEDHISHNAWSTVYPPVQASSRGPDTHEHDLNRAGTQDTPSRRRHSFAASSLNTVPFELEHTISREYPEPRLGPAGDDSFTAHRPAPSPPDTTYKTHDPEKISVPQQTQRSGLRGEITPYLGLRARLTQVPINRWTVLLLLVLARMLILFEGLNADFGDAQVEATSACAKVENVSSVLVSMPHFMSLSGEFQYFLLQDHEV